MLRLEGGGVADVAAGELDPGHERELADPSSRRRPSRSRAVPCSTAGSSGARARGSRAPAAAGLRERGEAEGDVGPVAQAPVLLVRPHAPCRRCRRASSMPRGVSPALDQCDAEVVAGVARARALERQAAQDAGRAGVVAARHQHVGLQQARAPPRARRAACARPAASASRPRAGSRAGSGSWRGSTRRDRAPSGRAARDQLLEDLARLLVHAVGQQHAAAQDLGLVGVVRHPLEVLRHLSFVTDVK